MKAAVEPPPLLRTRFLKEEGKEEEEEDLKFLKVQRPAFAETLQ